MHCGIWSKETVRLACDLLASPYEKFVRRWVEAGNIAAVAREIGRDRSHPSHDYRPRVVTVVTDVFMRLTGNGDHTGAASARIGGALAARVRRRFGLIHDCPQRCSLPVDEHSVGASSPERGGGAERRRIIEAAQSRSICSQAVARRRIQVVVHCCMSGSDMPSWVSSGA